MRNPFSDPNYLSGLHDPNAPSSEDTEDRSWLTFGKDIAIDALARPVVSAVRTGTQYARMADEENPTLQAIDTGVGAAQQWLMKERSPRAQALDTQSLWAGPDDRSFYREPIAGSIHAILPSVPYALAAILTGGTSLLAQGATAAAGGILGGSEAINELRDFADTTPIDQLKQLPVWDDLMAKAGGDERKARIQLFRDSLDPKSLTFNFLVNALEVPAFMRGVRGGAGLSGRAKLGLDVKNRALAAGEGATIGGLSGGLEGGTEAYIEEYAKQQRGETAEIDPAAVESGMYKGAVFAGPVSAFHAIAPTYKADGPAGTGPAEFTTLMGQLGQSIAPRPGITPNAPPDVMPPVFPPGDTQPSPIPQPGQGQGVTTPEAPLAPQFPEIEQPSVGGFDPADFGGEPPPPPPPPEQAGPPRPTRAQQLYQRAGVYDAEQPEQQQDQQFAATTMARLQRRLQDLEDGQLGREELLTNDEALLNFAANRGMEMDQARDYLMGEYERAEQQLGQLRAHLGTGAAFAQERQMGAPARRQGLRETGIRPTRVRPYGETQPTGQMEEGPAVVTPEEPLAPRFPMMGEEPEFPTAIVPPTHTYRKAGEPIKPARGTAEAPEGELEIEGEYTFGEAEPEQRQGIQQEEEDLIRSGVSVFTPAERKSFVGYLSQVLARSGRISRFELPPELRNEKDLNGVPLPRALTRAERAAVGRAAEYNPQQLIEIIRQPPTGTLAEHPVMHELQTRLRSRKQQEERAAEEARAEERRAAAKVQPLKVVKPPQRTGKEKTGMERGFEASLRGYKAAPFAQSREKWQALHKRAVKLDDTRAAAGLDRKYEKQLGAMPPSREALAGQRERERQQVAAKARVKHEERAAKRRRKLTRFVEGEPADVSRVHERPTDQPAHPELMFDQLVRNLEDLTSTELTMPDPTYTFRDTEEGRAHVEAVMERQADVAQLFRINAQRVANKQKQLPIPVTLYDTLVEAGLVWRPTESPYAARRPAVTPKNLAPKEKQTLEALIKMMSSTEIPYRQSFLRQTADNWLSYNRPLLARGERFLPKGITAAGITTADVERAQIAIGMMDWENSSENQQYTQAKLWSDHLRQESAKGYLRGRVSALVGSKERKRAQTVSEKLRARKLGTPRDQSMLPSRQQSEFGPIRRPAAGKVDPAERTTEKFKKEAARLTKAAIRGLLDMGQRFVNRVKADSEWDLIVTLAEERAAEARDRVARGLPPTREMTRFGKPIKDITLDQALERVRKGLPAFYDLPPDFSDPAVRVKFAGRKVLRGVEGWLPTVEQAIAAWKKGQTTKRESGRTSLSRSNMYKDRESVVNAAINNAVTNRFGTEKKFRALIEKLGILNKLPRKLLSARVKMPDVDPATQKWLTDVLSRETKTAYRPQRGYVEKPSERGTRMWLNAKREQVKLAKQLRKFLEHTITNTNRELDAHKKAKGYGKESESITWHLAKPMMKQITDKEGRPMGSRPTFQSGVEREGNWNYNFGNDLQKANAALDRLIKNLDEVEKGRVQTSARVLGKSQTSKKARKHGLITSERSIGRASTMAEEYGHYAGEFDAVVENVIDGMDRFLKDDLAGISKERALRNLIQTERRKGESYEAKQAEELGKESLAEGIQDRARTVEAAEEETAAQAEEIPFTDDVTYDPETGEADRPEIDLAADVAEELRPDTYETKGVDLTQAAGAEVIEALSNVPKDLRGLKYGYGDVIQYDPVLNENTPVPEITGGGQVALLEGRNVVEEEFRDLLDKRMKTLKRAISDPKADLTPKQRETARQKLDQYEKRMKAIRENFPYQPSSAKVRGGGRTEVAVPDGRTEMAAVSDDVAPLNEAEAAVFAKMRKATAGDVFSVHPEADPMSASMNAYVIGQDGRIYRAELGHADHLSKLAAAADKPQVGYYPDNYVHVSAFVPGMRDQMDGESISVGVETSSNITPAQAAMIRRLGATAQRWGEDGDTQVIFHVSGLGAEMAIPSGGPVFGKQYDQHGLPANRLPKWEKGVNEANLTNNQRRHVYAYDAFSLPGTPTHPLISAPQSAKDLISRVKQMLAAGITGHNLPSKYITPEFLDQLAANAGDVQIYHAPFDAVSMLGRRGLAFYHDENNLIALPNDVAPHLYVMAAVHELTHALEMRLMATDPRFAEEVRDLLQAAREYAEKQGVDFSSGKMIPRVLYGLTSPHEFLAETQSNEQFRQYLNRIKAPPKYGVISGIKSLMNALYKSIQSAFRRLMGAKDGDTALDALYYDQSTVLGEADKMVARTMDIISRHGRSPYIPTDPEMNFAGDGRNYVSYAGSKAFVADIVKGVGESGTEIGKAATHAWNTMDKNRGIGLVLHTLYDLTQRGSTELKRLAWKLMKTVELQNHERARILREIDKPKLDELEKFLNGLNDTLRKAAQAFIVDESYHGAYADALLSDPRNEHLFKRQTEEEKLAGTPRVFDDSLKNEQIKLSHDDMMKELERLEREAPGFKAMRDMIHTWARERETEMRRWRIRDFFKVTDLTFPTDKAELEKVMLALERAVDADKIDGERTMPRADIRTLRSVGDINSGPLKVLLDKIGDTADLDVKELAGPYTPFTRRGDYALSGNFVIPIPDGALVLEGGVNRETGEPIGNPRYVFKTEAEARAHIKSITDTYGVKLIKAGVIPIDTATGAPPRGYDPDDPDSVARLRGKALTKEMDRPGTTVQEQYYVQYQTKFLEFHESERAATDAKAQWEQHAKDKGFTIKLDEPKDVLTPEGRVNERYVGQQLLNLIRTAQASVAYQDLHPTEQAHISNTLRVAGQQYTMRRGLAQRYLPRGYVTGASTNLIETYAEWAGMTAGYLAKVKYAADIKDGTNQMRDHVKATGGSKDALVDSRIYNEFMQRMHAPAINPSGSWLSRNVERGLRWTMLDKLPSLAYFVVQLTEPIFVAGPLYTDYHNPLNIAGTMGSMYKLAGASKFMREGALDVNSAFWGRGERFNWAKLFGERVEHEADGKRLDDLFKQADARNYFDAAASLDFDRMYKSRNKLDRLADWLQAMFQSANTAIENLNRFVTIGTGYRLEFDRLTKKGVAEADAHQQAIDYALAKAHEANGIYSTYNAPPIFGSTLIGKIVFQFKKYPQRITANYIRAMVGTVKGFVELAATGSMSPEHKARAYQLAYMIATQGLVAGAMGLPTELFAVPLNTMYIAGLSKYNWDDVQAGYRQWAAKQFGVTGGEVASHGVLRLLGVDFASRLSQNNMWTFGSPQSRKPDDLMASLATMFSGALGSTSFEFLKGVQKAAAGAQAYHAGAWSVGNANMVEAGKNLAMFRMVGDVLDAARKMSPEGMRTASGRQMREPYGPWEAAAKAIGFTPSREAESSEARRAKDAATRNLKAERTEWIDLWTKASPSERTMMWPRIQRWNAGQSDPISQSVLLKAINARQKREKQSPSTLGLPTDKRSRQFDNIPAAYNL